MRAPINPHDFLLVIDTTELTKEHTRIFNRIEELIDRRQYQIAIIDQGFSDEVLAKLPPFIVRECYLIYGRTRNLSINNELLSKDFNDPAQALRQFDERRFCYIGPRGTTQNYFYNEVGRFGFNRSRHVKKTKDLIHILKQIH